MYHHEEENMFVYNSDVPQRNFIHSWVLCLDQCARGFQAQEVDRQPTSNIRWLPGSLAKKEVSGALDHVRTSISDSHFIVSDSIPTSTKSGA